MDNEREKLREAFLVASVNAKARQASDGAMPSGHNGPYRHPETPIRNTAHWAISFTRAWELTGDVSYRVAAERATRYLLNAFDAHNRRMLPCRRQRGKDVANGLMGQAWAIEGLAETGYRLGIEEALLGALELFCNHPYDAKAGGWLRLQPDGSPNGFDWNFNHQLWFCASGALLMLAGYDKPAAAVEDFCRRIGAHIRFYPSYLIRHANNRFLARGIRGRAVGAVRDVYYLPLGRKMWRKSLGYHCFNTYALALIERYLPAVGLLKSKEILPAFEYLCCDDFWDLVEQSPYGFPYNPPGWEAAFSIEVAFSERQKWVERWLKRQRQETWEPAAKAFIRQTRDIETAKARIYEATRLI